MVVAVAVKVTGEVPLIITVPPLPALTLFMVRKSELEELTL